MAAWGADLFAAWPGGRMYAGLDWSRVDSLGRCFARPALHAESLASVNHHGCGNSPPGIWLLAGVARVALDSARSVVAGGIGPFAFDGSGRGGTGVLSHV